MDLENPPYPSGKIPSQISILCFVKVNWTELTQGLLSSLRIERELRKSRLPRLGGSTVRRFPWTWLWPFHFSDFYLLCMMIRAGAPCSTDCLSTIFFSINMWWFYNPLLRIWPASGVPWDPGALPAPEAHPQARSPYVWSFVLHWQYWWWNGHQEWCHQDRLGTDGHLRAKIRRFRRFFTSGLRVSNSLSLRKMVWKTYVWTAFLCGLWDYFSGASETELTCGGWKWNIP